MQKLFKNSFNKLVCKFILLLVFFVIASISNSSFAGSVVFDFESLLREYPENINAVTSDKLESAKGDALHNKDAKTMFALGVMYRDAINVDRDYLQAREWFQKAVNLGDTDAKVALARLQMLDADITGFETSFESAVKNLEEAEKAGNKKAYYPIAELHEVGGVYERSYEKALIYFTKSAEAGDANGYVKIAHYNYYGLGTEKDKRKAIEALMKVSKLSSDKTVVKNTDRYLGLLFFQLALEQKNEELRYKLFELSWEYKNPLAADALGDLNQKGIGTKKDMKLAIEWYQKSIAMESIYGMEKLGYIYITGPDDVDRDFKKAQDLFVQGSELGGVNAAYYLGYMYYNGLGIEKNSQEAEKWFQRSKLLAERAKKKQENDEAIYQTFGAGYRDPLKETVENNEKVAQKTNEDNTTGALAEGSTINGLQPIGLPSQNIQQPESINISTDVPAIQKPQPQIKPFENLEQDPTVPALPEFKN